LIHVKSFVLNVLIGGKVLNQCFLFQLFSQFYLLFAWVIVLPQTVLAQKSSLFVKLLSILKNINIQPKIPTKPLSLPTCEENHFQKLLFPSRARRYWLTKWAGASLSLNSGE
jgi:hypothetical protein